MSGGGDSTALLHAAAERRGRRPVPLLAATVDHGLRPDSAAEAEAVGRACAALGIPHAVLRWEGWDGRGNLQDAARRARRRLLARWARGEGAAAVLLAHTRDDQAETVLLRLARGSGVDGLAGMGPAFDAEGATFLRPFLGLGRTELRAWLAARGLAWAEDPSNADPRFDRARARAMGAALADLGLTPDRLLATADHMARARTTLREAALAFVSRHARAEGGDVVIEGLDLRPGRDRAPDTPWRVLAGAVQHVGGGAYPPRWDGLAAAAAALRAGRGATLGGCLLRPEGGTGSLLAVRVARELRAAAAPLPPREAAGFWALWDRRWVVSGDGPGRVALGPLGEAGLAACPDWRATGLPAASLLATPALFDEAGTLVAAPVAGRPAGFRAVLGQDLATALRHRWGLAG